MYAPRRQQGEKSEEKREEERKKPDRRDEWIAGEAVVKRPLTPASSSSEVSSAFVFQVSMLAGGVHATVSKPWPQRNPKGPPAAAGGRAQQTQCQVETPPTPARQAGLRRRASEGGDGKVQKRSGEEKQSRMVRKCALPCAWIHILLAKWGWSTPFKGRCEDYCCSRKIWFSAKLLCFVVKSNTKVLEIGQKTREV